MAKQLLKLPSEKRNILFYVEPHGVRDSFTAHTLPFDYFRQIIQQIQRNPDLNDVEVRLFCNHFLANQKFTEAYDIWPSIIQPTPGEREAIEDCASMWRFKGMNEWMTLMNDEDSSLAQFYAGILHRIKKTEFDFDVIVCWGENAAVRSIAKTFGIQTIYMELASMRAPFPRAVLMDPKGVNGGAATVGIDISDIEQAITSLNPGMITALIDEELDNYNIPQLRFHPLSLELQNFLSTPDPVALVPLQLADDANQLLYSEHPSVESFAEHAVETLLEAGYRVILKGHPAAEQRGGYVMNTQRKCLARYSGNPRVLTQQADTPASEYLTMLEAVDLVVTNNSSVGFEAMLLGTRTVVMGRACYAPQNALPSLAAAIACRDEADMDALWKQRALSCVTYMLACTFPLSRQLGTEIVKRADLWSHSPLADKNPGLWVSRMTDEVAWTTWRQHPLLSHMTIKSQKKQLKKNSTRVIT